MPARTIITIPQPCAESWAAMTPTSNGRHCAACQKVVVDFSSKTDTEILAALARASAGSVCGRFRNEQLQRPLRELPIPARSRWRSWLAAALAVWASREGLTTTADAQAAGRPAAHRPARRSPRLYRPGLVPVMLRGVVREAASQAVLPGAIIRLRGAHSSRSHTDADGHFVLKAWVERQASNRYAVEVRLMGFRTTQAVLPSSPAGAAPTEISLVADESAAVQVIGYGTQQRVEYTGGSVTTIMLDAPVQPVAPSPPAPGWLRLLFHRLTQPFRRS